MMPFVRLASAKSKRGMSQIVFALFQINAPTAPA